MKARRLSSGEKAKRGPAAAGQLREGARALRRRRVREVDEGLQLARGVQPVDGHRGEDDAVRLVVPARLARAAPLRAHGRRLPRGGIEAVDAVYLVAARAAREEDGAARARLVARPGHGVGVVREGLGRRAGLGHAVHLVGVALAHAHEDLALRRVPVEQAPRLVGRVRLRLRGDLGGNRRDAVQHERGRGREELALRLRAEGGGGGERRQGADRERHHGAISGRWPRVATGPRTTRSTSRGTGASPRAPRAPWRTGCGRR